MRPDPEDTDADLFIETQDSVWDQVLTELSAGKKTGHWMWFVFPQLAALGQSDMSQIYGIHDLNEARAYLAHPTLRDRLVTVSRLMLDHAGTPPEAILGEIDAKKLRSSMTLFAATPEAAPEFARVLESYYGGVPCPLTQDELGRS